MIGTKKKELATNPSSKKKTKIMNSLFFNYSITMAQRQITEQRTISIFTISVFIVQHFIFFIFWILYSSFFLIICRIECDWNSVSGGHIMGFKVSTWTGMMCMSMSMMREDLASHPRSIDYTPHILACVTQGQDLTF